MWVVMDSNHRRRKPADLQSAPFGHSGNHPCSIASAKVYILADTAKGLTNFFATNIVCAVGGMINRVWLKLFIPLYFDITEKTLIFANAIADMAQLVEQRIRNAWVPGSSPGIGSISGVSISGISTSVVHGLPKPGRRVRFPYSALICRDVL